MTLRELFQLPPLKEAHSYRVRVQERIEWSIEVVASTPQEALAKAREAVSRQDRHGWRKHQAQLSEWVVSQGFRRWIER